MANIELPKDAEGREIPLDTKVLYNDRGVEYEVNRFMFGFDVSTHEVEWTAESYGTGDMVAVRGLRIVRGARRRRPNGCHRSARPMEPGPIQIRAEVA